MLTYLEEVLEKGSGEVRNKICYTTTRGVGG